MSAVQVNEYSSFKHYGQTGSQAERAKILNTVSRKAKDKTLTLQETNDLFAKFNNTYSLRAGEEARVDVAISDDGVDESWAVKLMKECEQEDGQANKKQVRTVNYSRPALLEA